MRWQGDGLLGNCANRFGLVKLTLAPPRSISLRCPSAPMPFKYFSLDFQLGLDFKHNPLKLASQIIKAVFVKGGHRVGLRLIIFVVRGCGLIEAGMIGCLCCLVGLIKHLPSAPLPPRFPSPLPRTQTAYHHPQSTC